ncbi:enoyl-CoA hydratase/isomerase family protein [Gordonia sp. CPCC 205515]|uniref:enoyl-CoA hydratase/isomerase family protein n=1 Tax=Gordonia sp. CPCC 205515 TaxID=3140791 RepID=UPI003AF3ACCF
MLTKSSSITINELTDRVVLTLDRPASRNAITAEMIAELHDVCSLIEADPRPLLIHGAGDHFAGGADIGQLRDRRRDDALAGINRTLFDRIAALPLPTVAAVNGYALGGGAELAYACDIRIATPTARFGNPEPGLGILAAAGATYRLPDLVGGSVARQILLGARILTADDAHRHGLVAEVVAADDLLPAAHALLDRIAASSPLALRMTKSALASQSRQIVSEDIIQAVLFETSDKQDRMTAFLERKK